MMGRVAALAVERDPAWTLAAVADPSSAARDAALQTAPGIAAYNDAEAMVTSAALDRDAIDIVLVATPPDTHCSIAVSSLAAGRHVICEKPMAPTPTECDRMVEAADAAGPRVVAIIDHQLRYNRARAWIHEQLSSGALGAPLQVDVVATFPGLVDTPWSWWSSLTAGGGLLNEYGSHTVDLLHWWFGPSESATGITRTIVDERRDVGGALRPVDSDDIASFRLSWPVGLFADVRLSSAAARPERTTTIHTDQATITLDADDTVHHWPRRSNEASSLSLRELEPSLIGDGSDTYTQPFTRLLRDVRSSIDRGDAVGRAASFRDGAAIIERLTAIRTGCHDRETRSA